MRLRLRRGRLGLRLRPRSGRLGLRLWLRSRRLGLRLRPRSGRLGLRLWLRSRRLALRLWCSNGCRGLWNRCRSSYRGRRGSRCVLWRWVQRWSRLRNRCCRRLRPDQVRGLRLWRRSCCRIGLHRGYWSRDRFTSRSCRRRNRFDCRWGAWPTGGFGCRRRAWSSGRFQANQIWRNGFTPSSRWRWRTTWGSFDHRHLSADTHRRLSQVGRNLFLALLIVTGQCSGGEENPPGSV